MTASVFPVYKMSEEEGIDPTVGFCCTSYWLAHNFLDDLIQQYEFRADKCNYCPFCGTKL